MVKLFAAILFSFLVLCGVAEPQVPQSNFSINSGNRQYLHGEVPEAINSLGLKPLNRLASTKQLHLVISLPLRNQDALKQLIQEIYDPSNPNYHKYLTPEKVNQQFGPSEQDYQALVAFAVANHLKVTQTHNSRMLLEVSGAVADVENVFHVHMFEYKRPESDSTFYAPDVEPSIDLAIPIQQIKGLNNYFYFHPNSVFSKIKSSSSSNPNGGSSRYGLYIGDDFRNAYAPGVSLNGSGQSVGQLQFDGYNTSDITNYEASANRSGTVILQNILIGGVKGTPITFDGRGEVTLDIDMAIAMAPGLSKVVIFAAPNKGQYFDVILDSMSVHSEIKQFSTSWALTPDGVDLTADSYFERMAIQGQSFFCASGDNDAYSSTSITMNGKKLSSKPGFPESDTNITEVGGTLLGMNSNGATWSSDRVWNTGYDSLDNLYLGSGGGVSTVNSIPSWQKTVSTANNRSTTMRNIPDAALTADSIFVTLGDTAYIFSGTSCAAPLWAGFTALVNQQAVAAGGQTVGFINPAVYSIGNGTKYSTDFHDVTSGDNKWPGSPNLYSAVSGYDLATGWGTPNGQNLIDDLSGSLPGQITNGIVTPASGSTTTQFSFSVSYKSPTGQAPDSINIVIDNKSYKMTAQGSLWGNGVLFNYTYPALFSAGQHSYYFLGSIAGSVNIRYPASGTLQFTALAGAPGIVQQVSPLNNSLGNIQPVKLKWTSSTGATSYRLQSGLDSTFASTVKDTIGLTDTTFNVSSLSNLTTYYWRVNAANLIGTSVWSQIWSFKTLGNPGIATLLSPNSSSIISDTASSIIFTWTSASFASTYDLQIASNNNFSPVLTDTSGITDTVFTYHPKNIATTFYWRVQGSNAAGAGPWSAPLSVNLITGINNIKSGIPVAYSLYQNYPNPFNPSTLIRFALPFSSNVKIEVYNILGEKVRELLNEQKSAGYYEVDFNTTGLASGIYLYMIEAKSMDGKSAYRNVKKMVLLK